MTQIEQRYANCLNAADRKVKIASFHLHCLKQELNTGPFEDGNLPSIAIQAHFEGIVISVVAAIDQVAQAANYGFVLHLEANRLVEGGYSALSARIPEIKVWYNDNLGIDLRRVRTRMVHYSYEKRPLNMVWTVEATDSRYPGSRELASYGEAATAYGLRLVKLFPKIKQTLLEQC